MTAAEAWSQRVVRVLAPNPSPMTLEGTNTFVVGAPVGAPAASGVVVIDPGPNDDGHLWRVLKAGAGRPVELILLTHAHPDHADGARVFAELTGAPIAAVDQTLATAGAPALAEERALRAGGVELLPVLTPGHAPDHCCFLLTAERAMFTGDHVLGRGSSVVVWPEGDMQDYLRSLEALRALEPERLYPGHGPAVPDAEARLGEYVAHRLEREREVLAALEAGDRTPPAVVARVYADVDRGLWPAAELSVRAHLVKLVREGRVLADGDRFEPIP
jgi:glyoxylase-like metal-dependent hydrolase (beta-lactamase superfamily II)